MEHASQETHLSAVGNPNEKPSEESPSTVDHGKTFAASILVERAMHLSLKGESSLGLPELQKGYVESHKLTQWHLHRGKVS